MKKHIPIGFVILFCVMTLLFASCGSNTEENVSFSQPVTDDLKTLDSGLTTEYDLDVLNSFFNNSNMNETIGFYSDVSILSMHKVNHSYPIEILRTGGYSVYKVQQGGYFYVFWVESVASDTSQATDESSVYFSAYLSSDRSSSLFDSLTPGISTAEDVKQIDPSFELSFLMSNGIYSYSYLNDETLLRIEYICAENLNSYEDLTIKEIEVISRASAPARYSSILSSDLPA